MEEQKERLPAGGALRPWLAGLGRCGTGAAMLLMLAGLGPAAWAQTATTTTLALSSSSVAWKTAVTLTATVSNGSPVTLGQVWFCNAAATYCDNGALVGTAQLTSAGTAIIKLVPPIGSHSYYAKFKGTNSNTTSTSATQPLTVTGSALNATTSISSSGSVGNYTLTGTVTGVGSGSIAPTGSVSFLDTSNSNANLGTASLGASVPSTPFATYTDYIVGTSTSMPQSVAVGDFNGDGIPDMAVTTWNDSMVTILLGNGDGTFTTKGAFSSEGLSPSKIVAADFNGDGKLDLAVANYNSGTIVIFLGNGDGTFTYGHTINYGQIYLNFAVGDFTGGGIPDIAIVNAGDSLGALCYAKFYLGDGTGNFAYHGSVSFGSTAYRQATWVGVADVNGDGKADLIVATEDDSGSNGEISVLLGQGNNNFSASTDFVVDDTPPGHPVSVAIGDFRNNGVLDLAVAANNNFVFIFENDGTGTFTDVHSYPVSNPSWITTGDFNGDGKLDLAVVSPTTYQMTILQGNGDDSFTAMSPYTTDYSVDSVAAADFDGDGAIDLVTTNGDIYIAVADTVSVFLNRTSETATASISNLDIPGTGSRLIDASYAGDGNYPGSISSTISLSAQMLSTALTLSASPSASSPYGDSVLLTATLSPYSDGSLVTTGETVTFKSGSTVLGTGALNASGVATLSLTTLSDGTDSLTAVYAGDSDFATSASSPLSYSITAVTTLALSASSVTAGTAVTLTASVSGAGAQTAGTVNFCDATAAYCDNGALLGTAQLTSAGTAIIKLIPGIGSHSYMAVFRGVTTLGGSSSTAQPLTVTGGATTTTISSSGSVGNYTLTGTVVGTGSRTLSPSGSVSFLDASNGNYSLGSATLGAAVKSQSFVEEFESQGSTAVGYYGVIGDLNGDGIPDIAITRFNYNGVSTLLGIGDGTFQAAVLSSGKASPSFMAAGDFNGDGNLDLVLMSSTQSPPGPQILLGKGDGTFQTPYDYTVMGGHTALPYVAVGDFNRDGNLDLVVPLAGEPNVAVLWGNGAGAISSQSIVGMGCYSGFVAVADFNGDGIPDIVTANTLPCNGGVSVMLSNGDGTFQSPINYTNTHLYSYIATGDLRSNGKTDLVTVRAGYLDVFLGNGDGTFAAASHITTTSNPVAVAIGDFNGDGIPDIAVSDQSNALLTIYSGNGDGTFSSGTVLINDLQGTFVAAADLNHDGTTDLVWGAVNTSVFEVFLNSVTQTATATHTGISVPGSGSHNVEASYGGDSNFGVSASATTPLAGTQVTTALGLSASPSLGSNVGQSVTLTATLSPSPVGNLSANTETATFKSGLSTVGTGTFNASGVATLILTTLPGGLDSLTAVYAGDSNFTGMTSSALSYTVISVVVSPTSETLTAGTVGTAYSQTFTGSGGSGSFTYAMAVTGGSLPAGMTLSGGSLTGTPTAIGSCTFTVQATDTSGSPGPYSSPLQTYSFTVGQGTAAVVLGSLAQTYTGSPLAATATTTPASLTVNFTYTGTSGTTYGPSTTTPTAAGSYLVAAAVSNANYTGTASGTMVIGQATATVTLSNLAQTYSGSPLAATATTTPSSLTVTFTYTNIGGTTYGPTSTAPTAAGSYTVAAAINDANYTGTANGTLAIAPIGTVLSWLTPSAITYGTTLSTTQLNASSGGVTGAFTYNPLAGTTPLAGTDTLSVSFVPTDTTDYTTPLASTVQLVVHKATPVLSWATPASIPYGTVLSSTQLNATSGGVAGIFTYSPLAGTTPAAGSDTLAATFAPTDAADYNTPSGTSVQLTVVAAPILSMAFAPNQIALGGVSTLTFQINSPTANTVALSGVSLSNNLPAGLSVATPNGLTSNCGGTATALAGGQSIQLSGVSIATSSSCLLSVNVTAAVSSGYTDTSSAAASSNGGTGNAAYANLMVAGGVTLTPSTIAFANQVVGTTSAAQTFTLTNIAASVLTISTIDATGDFSQTTNCGATLQPGASCAIFAVFSPTAMAAGNGSVIVVDSAGVQVSLLTGTGIEPGVQLSSLLLSFGSQVIDTSSGSQSATLTNNGDSNLTINSVSASGDFAVTGSCVSGSPLIVAASGTCGLSVIFTPTSTGTRNGSVTISDSLGTQVIALSGTGNAAGVSLSLSSLAFGSQVVGTTSTADQVTLTNSGSSDLTINGIAADGDFAESDGCVSSSPISPGGSCNIDVTFTPTATGARSGTVTISDSVGTHVIALTGAGIAAGVELSPASLSFGSQTIGATSGTQPVTLTNSGGLGSTLSIGSVTASGDFAQTNNCISAGSLAQNGSCTITVFFTPSGTGALSGSLVIVDGAGTQVVALIGTGATAGATLSQPTLSFGNVTVGASASLVSNVQLSAGAASSLTVTGATVSGDYALVNNCNAAIAPGAACGLSVTFNPAAAGARTGTAIVSYTLGTSAGQLILALNGTGTNASAGLSPTSLSFGNEAMGMTTAAQSITLTDNGSSALSISGINAAGDFAQTNNCINSLAPTASCTINVTFTPAATGIRFGTVTVTDGAGTHVVTLTGTGTAPGVTLTPSTLSFGSQVVITTSTPQPVTLTNSGTSDLSIASITANGDFASSNNCASPLAATASCTISVTFTPTANGARSGTVTITDGAGTHVVTLTGTGTAPGVTLTPSILSFGSQAVNTTSAAQTVILTNSGTSNISIAGIAADGDFASTNNCASSLAPGSACTLSVTFTPTSTGTRNGSVTITDGAGTHVVTLSGVGNAPGVGLTSSTLIFGSQTVGTASGAQTVVLTNSGTSSLTLSSFTAVGDFAVTSSDCPSLPLSLAVSGACTLQVTFTPTAEGPRTGSVVIADSTGSHVVALAGTGTAVGVSLSPSNLVFGSVVVGATSQLPVALQLSSNTASSLLVTGALIDGDYTLTNNCAAAVAPGGSCGLSITFAPTATGLRSGTALVSYTVGATSGTLVLALSGTGTAPGVMLSSSTLSFGSQVVNTTSTVQTVTLTNSGTSDLSIASITANGDFASTNNCTNSLATNASCTIGVTFTPVATGTRNGTVTIADGAGTHVVTLTGRGNAPGVTLAPSTLLFGSQIVNTASAAQTVTLSNSGTSDLSIASIAANGDFASTNNCGSSLAAGSACTLSVTFTPVATGTRNGTVTIIDGSGTHVVTLNGTGNAPGVTLTPSTLLFGSQVVNTASAAQTVALTNSGTSGLFIASITANGDFASTNNCGSSLAANASCTIGVTFTPAVTGTRSGTVTITDGAGTHVATLTGTGTAPGVTLTPSNLTFGSEVVGVSSVAQAVTVANTGTSSLIISSISAAGDFTQTDNCTTIAAGASCSIQAVFTPTASGTRSGVITLVDNAGVQEVVLTGTGNMPGVALSPSTLIFGSQTVGTVSSVQTVIVSNTGTSTLTVNSVNAAGDFSQTDNCATIVAGASCSIQVIFTPTAIGLRNGAIALSDNAGTHVIALTGTGDAPGISLMPSTLIFGSEVVGTTSAAQWVTVGNIGTSTLTVSSVTAAGDFSQTNNCTILAPGASCSIQAAFVPTAAGTRNGTITLIDSAGTHVIAMSGIGDAPGVALSVSQIDFGSQTVGTSSATQSATITNLGSSVLAITGLSASGDFTVSSPDCGTLPTSVPIGVSCTLQVIFSPVATGVRTGTVIVTDSNGTHTIALSGTGSAVGVSLSPGNVNFGSVIVGNSAQLTANVAIDLTTSGVLNVTSLSISGDFSVVNQCISTVSPGQECGLSITFTPTAVGVRTGTAVVTYTVGTGTGQLILSLTGNGVGDGLILTPSSLAFGSQFVQTASSSQTVLVQNASAQTIVIGDIAVSGSFTQTNNCGTLVSNATCSIQAVYAPNSTGATDGLITVDYTISSATPGVVGRAETNMQSASTGSLLVALTGVANQPGVSIVPSTLNFGGVALNASSSVQPVSISNTGNSLLSVTSITPTGDFTQTNNCTAVQAGANCTIDVIFSPTASGVRNGTITLVDSAGTHVVVLTGTGNLPGIVMTPPLLTFGSIAINATSGPQTVTINNTGSNAVTISSITAAGDFSQTNNCATLAAGASCAIQAEFSPTASGTRSGLVALMSSLGTYTSSMSGTGIQESIGFSPANLTFPLTTVTKTSAAQKLTITNYGITSLAISSITASAEFAESDTCSAMLAPGANCTASVTFNPAAYGTRNGILTIVSNGQGSPQQVSLTGSGADFALAMSVGASSTAQVTAGATATYQTAVSALTYQGLVTLICVGAPQGSTCTVQPVSVSLTGANSAPITVTVTTTASAAQTSGLPIPGSGHAPWWLWLAGAAGIFIVPRRRDTWRRYGAGVAVLLIALLVLMPISGCGGWCSSCTASTGNSATPSGTYPLMLVGTSADGVQHSLQLSLQVN